jgi:hypothetical protein
MKNYNIVAITVSTNYDDYLCHVLESNYKYFKHWYIITEETDKATIDLCSKYPNVEVLFFTFKDQNSVFNKGGALRYAQMLAHERFKDEWFLILDSDICLPLDFAESINKLTLDENVVYGADRRICRQISDRNVGNLIDTYNKVYVIGFFQLYKCKHLYDSSYDCSKTDTDFTLKFKRFEWLNIIVDHLGDFGQNWKERISQKFSD